MPFKLNCREASRLLSRVQDHRLGPGERLGLWLHLKACDACLNFEKQMALLRRAMLNYREPRE